MNVEGGYPDESSGHSGSSTSRERAEREDNEGVTGKRQERVFEIVRLTLNTGIVCSEVESWLKCGHGAASGALTRLHRAGKITRLKQRRFGQEIYVHPTYINDREPSPYRPNVAYRKHPRDMNRDEVMAVMMDAGVDESMFYEVQAVLRHLP